MEKQHYLKMLELLVALVIAYTSVGILMTCMRGLSRLHCVTGLYRLKPSAWPRLK